MARADLLSVRGLNVRYPGADAPALGGLDLDLGAGECVAVTGPSGSGKSTLCRALLDLLPEGTLRTGGIRWRGEDLMADPVAWRRLRGRAMGLVLQDHRHALDPLRTVGAQVAEVRRRHRPDLDRRTAADDAIALLAEVDLPEPAAFARRYPHQMSGGQRQRVGLAVALAADPELLLADEPTTALDLLTRRDIVLLLAGLVRRRGMGLLLVSHDEDLVARLAHRTVTLPGAGAPGRPGRSPLGAGDGPVILTARNVTAAAGEGSRRRTVAGPLDLDLRAGRTLGLAGASGAGKTSLARVLAGWTAPAAGTLQVALPAAAGAGEMRRAVQLVSQDPSAALDPRQTAASAVAEAARAAGAGRAEASDAARSLLAEVGIEPDAAARIPAELSGGQRQRVQLARALAARPRVLVADEPASSLDPRRQGAVLALLDEVRHRHDLALLLISHDLRLLERWCDDIAVLLDGVLMERYPVPAGPRHPYTRALAAAADWSAGDRPTMDAPEGGAVAGGCPFAPHCPLVQEACRRSLPALRTTVPEGVSRCPITDREAR